MNRSSRDPDAIDRIREDTSVLGRTCGYCGFTGDMMAYAQHVCPRDVMQSEIDSLRARLAAANAKDSEKTRDINLLTQENRQQAAQLAAATERERVRLFLIQEAVDCLTSLLGEDEDELHPEVTIVRDRLAAALAAAQPASGGGEGE